MRDVRRLLRVTSTADVPTQALARLEPALAPDVAVTIEDRQMVYRSAEPPSWVMLLTDADWWLKGLAAYAALYIAELVKEGAKATWRSVARLRTPKQDPLGWFAEELAKLRASIAERTKIEVGLPVPNDYFATHLPVVGDDAELIVLQLALYVYHLPALVDLIDRERLRERAFTGVFLQLEESGDLNVSWIENGNLAERSVTLRVRA